MSSNQDPTSPITDGTPRLDRDDVYHQPVFWIYGAGFVLLSMGMSIISLVNPPSRGTWLWVKVGVFLIALGFFAMLTIPGALAAMHHPWGAAYRSAAGRRFAHPQLIGLAEISAGLVLSGGLGVFLFAPYPLTSPPNWYWLPAWALAFLATFLIAVSSLVALYLFDRRR